MSRTVQHPSTPTKSRLEIEETMLTSTQENLNVYDQFLALSAPDRLQKILARYELFKMLMDVPGDIVECGVFKGSGIFTWAKLMQIFRPNNDVRIIGFDFFDTDRSVALEFNQDLLCLEEHKSGWSGAEQIMDRCNSWGFRKVDLIRGDVVKTTEVDRFCETACWER